MKTLIKIWDYIKDVFPFFLVGAVITFLYLLFMCGTVNAQTKDTIVVNIHSINYYSVDSNLVKVDFPTLWSIDNDSLAVSYNSLLETVKTKYPIYYIEFLFYMYPIVKSLEAANNIPCNRMFLEITLIAINKVIQEDKK